MHNNNIFSAIAYRTEYGATSHQQTAPRAEIHRAENTDALMQSVNTTPHDPESVYLWEVVEADATGREYDAYIWTETAGGTRIFFSSAYEARCSL